MLTADRLKELLHYDPETGAFTWRVYRARKAKVGYVAGTEHDAGRVRIHIDGKLYLAHRLAWLYMTGAWPKDQIDHRDGNPSNNRWANLREATPSQNQANRRASNSKLGVKGVRRHGRKFRCEIRANGERIYLGLYDTIAEAKAIRDRAARDLHGEFARAS